MSLLEGLKSAPKLYFVLDGLLFLGFVLLVVGLASNEWGVVTTPGDSSPISWSGLWNTCQQKAGAVRCFRFPSDNPCSLVMYRGLAVTAVVVAGGSGLFAVACTALPRLRTRLISLLLGSACFLSFGLDLVTIILYIGRYTSLFGGAGTITFGWSLGVAGAGGVICFVAYGLTYFMAAGFDSPPSELRLSSPM